MGFEQTSMNGPKTFIKIGSEKDNNGVITSKFFVATKKTINGYEETPMVDKSGRPTPFFAYLTKIETKLDNIITKKDGNKIPSPKVLFEFTDDAGERFTLDVPFVNEKGRVSNYLFGFLNSLAGIVKFKEFGYLNIYLAKSVDKNNSTITRYNLGVRNAVNWVAGSKNYGVFNTEDTKVDWGYKIPEIPSYETEAVNAKGKTVTGDNTEEHQGFFLDIIKTVNAALDEQRANYDIGSNASASMNKTTYTTDDVEDDDSVAEFAHESPANLPSEELDDLPF